MAKKNPPTIQDFEAKFAEEKAKQRRPTILVLGYMGSGKTSLIRAMCGPGVVPASAIGAGFPKTSDFDFYESASIRFFDSKGLEPGTTEEQFVNNVHEFVHKVQQRPNVDDHIHLVWYALQGPGARVSRCDLRLMKSILSNSQIVLITKNDITRAEQRDAMIQVLAKEGIPRERIVPCSELDADSLRALEQLSYDMLPAAYRDAFTAAQVVNLDRKRVRAQAIIHAAAASAAGVALTPLPFSDSLLITPVQVSMLAGLALNYGESAATLRQAFLPVLAESVGIQTAASLSKFLPGFGSLISAGVAAALTEAVGQITDAFLVKRAMARIAGEPEPEFVFDPAVFFQYFRRAKEAQ